MTLVENSVSGNEDVCNPTDTSTAHAEAANNKNRIWQILTGITSVGVQHVLHHFKILIMPNPVFGGGVHRTAEHSGNLQIRKRIADKTAVARTIATRRPGSAGTGSAAMRRRSA